LSATGRVAGAAALRRPRAGDSERSSTRATQEPVRAQSGQLPGFELANPQSWQR
jgi:hypothetical protein